METPLEILAVAVSLLVFAYLLWQGLVLYRFTRLRLRRSERLDVSREEIPEAIRDLYDLFAQPLEALGFRYLRSLGIRPILVGQPGWSYVDCYEHAETGAIALVENHPMPEAALPVMISFHNCFADGRTLKTMRRSAHLLLPVPPQWRVIDDYSPSLAKQWEFHRQQVESAGQALVKGWEEYQSRAETLLQQLPLWWEQLGWTRPAGPGQWRLSLSGAWRLIRQFRAGAVRLKQAPAPEAVAIPIAHEIAAGIRHFHQTRVTEQGTLATRGMRLGLFLLTLAIGIGAAATFMEWSLIPMFFALLLLHEFGHALAMKLSGYSNVSVFFVPFLGALATADKDDAGPWQKLFVYLAGPIPGLVLGILCLYLALSLQIQPEFLVTLGAIAISLNYFNLLPFTPLDGGQVVETFLFSRLPLARVVFLVLSLGSLIALAWWLDIPILYLIAAMFALGLPGSLRLARLLRATSQHQPQPEAAALERIYQALISLPALAGLNSTQRYALAKAALPHLLSRPPRLMETVLAMGIYLGCLLAPVALAVQVVSWPVLASVLGGIGRDSSPRTPTSPRRDWADEYAQAEGKADKRWEIASEAAWAHEEDEPERWRFWLSRAYQDALEAFGPVDDRTLEASIRLASGQEENAQAMAELEALLDLIRTHRAQVPSREAAIYEALVQRGSERSEAIRIGWLRRAIELREWDLEHDGEHRYFLIEDRRTLAVLLVRNGDRAGAESLLRRNLEPMSRMTELNDYLLATNTLDLAAWLLLEGRLVEMEQLLAAPPLPTRKTTLAPLLDLYASGADELRAWGYIQRREFEPARPLLQRQAEAGRVQAGLDLIHVCEHLGETSCSEGWLAKLRQQTARLTRIDHLIHSPFAYDRLGNGWEMPWLEPRRQILARLR